MKSNKVLEKIFDIKYITFFEKYYMKKEKTIELRIFWIEKEIILSKKTKTYYEFLENEKSKAKDEKYINQINECLNKYYLKKKKFISYWCFSFIFIFLFNINYKFISTIDFVYNNFY